MIPSFQCSPGRKGEGNDSAVSKKPDIKHEIQPLSDLSMFTHSVPFYITGKKIKHSQFSLT